MKKTPEVKSAAEKSTRYTVLAAEIKRTTEELKVERKKMLDGIKALEAAYRKYRKEVYAPARKAALDAFKAAKPAKKTDEKPADEKPAKVKTEKPAKKAAAKKPAKKTAEKLVIEAAPETPAAE